MGSRLGARMSVGFLCNYHVFLRCTNHVRSSGVYCFCALDVVGEFVSHDIVVVLSFLLVWFGLASLFAFWVRARVQVHTRIFVAYPPPPPSSCGGNVFGFGAHALPAIVCVLRNQMHNINTDGATCVCNYSHTLSQVSQGGGVFLCACVCALRVNLFVFVLYMCGSRKLCNMRPATASLRG